MFLPHPFELSLLRSIYTKFVSEFMFQLHLLMMCCGLRNLEPLKMGFICLIISQDELQNKEIASITVGFLYIFLLWESLHFGTSVLLTCIKITHFKGNHQHLLLNTVLRAERRYKSSNMRSLVYKLRRLTTNGVALGSKRNANHRWFNEREK